MKYERLIKSLENVCPGCGVRIGTLEDKATWELVFSASATEEEKSEAQAVLDSVTEIDMSPVKYIPCKDVIERLSALGKYETIKATMSEVQKDIFFSLKEGIALDDADVIALLTACGVDASQVLY